MLLHDGELTAETAARVAALLAEDAGARDKLATMQLLGSLLRETVDGESRADGITDAVMARVASEPAPRRAAVPEAAVDPAAQHDMLRRARPANDNSRTIYAMALAAAAVAAGLFIWGRTGASDGQVAAQAPVGPPAVEAPAEPAAETLASEAGSATADDPADETDSPAGVEIASVDFGPGAQSGAVFMISGGKSSAPTAVVWVTDLGEE
jgi:negative regulator of sigma E activity